MNIITALLKFWRQFWRNTRQEYETYVIYYQIFNNDDDFLTYDEWLVWESEAE